MDKKLIIFDKDGTLLDFDAFWIPVSEAALSYIVAYAKLPSSVVSEIFDAFDVREGVTSITSELCHGTYASMGRVIFSVIKRHTDALSENEIIALTREAYHKYMDKGEIKPTSPKLYEALKKLYVRGITLAVVTTDAPLVTEECLNKLGIREFFTFVLSDDGIMPAKPSPASLDFVREKLSLSKNEILMVGDTLTDVSYAKAGGIQVVGVAKTEENAEILRNGGANFVIHDASEVCEVLSNL